MDKRWHRVQWGAAKARQRTSASNWKAPLDWEKGHEEFNRAHGRRRRVFCASLADVFDNEAPPQWRGELWALVKATPHLDWLVLTKRVGNVQGMAPAEGLPPNVWLGATIVNQEEADRDIPKLLDTPASVRFVSIEPMLGEIRLGSFLKLSPSAAFVAGKVTREMPAWTRIGSTAIDWVIVGGESGHGARPIQREWVNSLRRECEADGVAFFFKQWGGATAAAGGCLLDGIEVKAWPR